MNRQPPLDLEGWALAFPDAAAALFAAFAGQALPIPPAWSRDCIGERFANARAMAGFTQAGFADAARIPLERLRLCEHGFCPLERGLLRRAAELGLDVRYVLLGHRRHSL
jgi:hypothetical protein